MAMSALSCIPVPPRERITSSSFLPSNAELFHSACARLLRTQHAGGQQCTEQAQPTARHPDEIPARTIQFQNLLIEPASAEGRRFPSNDAAPAG